MSTKLSTSFVFLLFSMSSCDALPPSTKNAQNSRNSNQQANGKGSHTPLTPEQQFAQAQKQQSELLNLLEQKYQNLSELTSVNEALCQKLIQTRKDCTVTQRIVDNPQNNSLGCISKDDTTSPDTTDYSVTLTASDGSGSFTLKANNGYESSQIPIGQETKISFKTLGTSKTLSPRLFEVTTLGLYPTAGSVLPQITGIKFQFKSGEKVLLTEQNFFTTSSGTYYAITLTPIQDLFNSAVCKVADEDITQITLDAKSKAATTLPDELKPHSADRNNPPSLETLQSNIDELNSNVGKITKSSENEEDRNGKLLFELVGDQNTGCFADENINELEILIDGAHLDSKTLSSTLIQKQSTGSPSMFNFRFSDQMAYTHPDEEQQSIFISNGKTTSSNLSSFKVRDFSQLSIEKGGVGVNSIKNCGNIILVEACDWNNSEKNIYRLDSLVINVNGEELYRNSGINFTFQNGSLKWTDSNFILNDSYKKLMKRTDCKAK